MVKPKDDAEAQVGQPTAWADLRKRRKGVKTQVVPVVMDLEAMTQIQVLEDDLREAVDADNRTNGPKQAPHIATRIAELEEQARASIYQFKLRSVGSAWDTLMSEHPPTEDQRKRGHIVNIDEFKRPAVLATLIDPVVDADDADEFWSDLDAGTRDSLFTAAMQANQAAVSAVPSSRLASALLRGSGETSTTAALGASRTASS